MVLFGSFATFRFTYFRLINDRVTLEQSLRISMYGVCFQSNHSLSQYKYLMFMIEIFVSYGNRGVSTY